MQEYMGGEYVNNRSNSDVTFMVDGAPFYTHRAQLEASSDLLANGRDRKLRPNHPIEIPNIRRPVFEAMMRCVYTGTVEVAADIAQVCASHLSALLTVWLRGTGFSQCGD
jgi:hypothetical protein